MTMRNWSDLRHEMLELIAQRLPRIEDYAAFGAVCTSWRAAASDKKNFKGLRLWQQIPCLMLAPEDDENDAHREFYSLMESEITDRIRLPQIKGKKCYESLGWLLVVGDNGAVSLFHPFTGAEIPLPDQNFFPEFDVWEIEPHLLVRKMVLSSSPTDDPDFVVAIIWEGMRFLAFWRPGDISWNTSDNGGGGCAYSDIIFSHGQFYAIDDGGGVVGHDLKGPNPTTAKVITHFSTDINYPYNELVWDLKIYLVAPLPKSRKSSQKLLIVTRDGSERSDTDADTPPTYGTTTFRVFELDLVRHNWKEMKSLGEMAIFLGDNASMSMRVSSSKNKNKWAPGIMPNRIYFTDDCWETQYYVPEQAGKDMGVYNLETGSIEPFFKGNPRRGPICKPIWITPHF